MVATTPHRWGHFELRTAVPKRDHDSTPDRTAARAVEVESVIFSASSVALVDARTRTVWSLEHVIVNWAFVTCSCAAVAARFRTRASSKETEYAALARWLKVTRASADRVPSVYRERLRGFANEIDSAFADSLEDAHYRRAPTDGRSRADLRVGGLLWSFEQILRACYDLTGQHWPLPSALERLASIPSEFWSNVRPEGADLERLAQVQGKVLDTDAAKKRIRRFASIIRDGHEEAVIIIHLDYALARAIMAPSGRLNIRAATEQRDLQLG